MSVYCMDCGRMGCEKTVEMKTGWVIINLETGKKDSNGVKVNVGHHPQETK